MKKSIVRLLTALVLGILLSLLSVSLVFAAAAECGESAPDAPASSAESGDVCEPNEVATPTDADSPLDTSTAEASESETAEAGERAGENEASSPVSVEDAVPAENGEQGTGEAGSDEDGPGEASHDQSLEQEGAGAEGADEVTLEDPAGEAEEGSEPLVPSTPEDVSVVVLDENGDALPLATQEAADILAVPDPQFCPAGLSFGDLGCGPVRETIGDAIADAKAADVAGTVFVEAGTYVEDVSILLFTNDLTLVGLMGSGSTFIDGFLLIEENTADIGVHGFSIFDPDGGVAVDANNNAGTLTLADVVASNGGDDGIVVTGDDGHEGDVVLVDVVANGNGGNGAGVFAQGSVDVRSSSFDDNSEIGLLVVSSEGVTLEHVDANNNGDAGVVVDAEGNISVYGGDFEGNYFSGLALFSDARVRVKKVGATNNGQSRNDSSCDPEFDFCGGAGAFIGLADRVYVEYSQFNNNASRHLQLR